MEAVLFAVKHAILTQVMNNGNIADGGGVSLPTEATGQTSSSPVCKTAAGVS